jgi:hypothetical protein
VSGVRFIESNRCGYGSSTEPLLRLRNRQVYELKAYYLGSRFDNRALDDKTCQSEARKSKWDPGHSASSAFNCFELLPDLIIVLLGNR